jgi:hypothetical protein
MPSGQSQRNRSVRTLHSIHALVRQNDFVGEFDAGGARYRFTYSPKSAEVAGGTLQLNGQFMIKGPGAKARTGNDVRAVLAGSQGATSGSPPPRPTKITAPDAASESADAASAKLSATENSGSASFGGVMYFKLEMPAGRGLVAPVDISRVQLNVRLYPTDDTARVLHGVYSSLIDALHGGSPSPRTAEALIKELNTLYGGSSVAAPG